MIKIAKLHKITKTIAIFSEKNTIIDSTGKVIK